LPEGNDHTETYSIEIPSSHVNGPLDLGETILSAQTSEPEWRGDQTSFTDVEILSGIPVKYKVDQAGNTDDFKLRV